MSDPSGLGARALEAVRTGRAARPARLAAARGALPLTPAELAHLQILLLADADAEIAEAAQVSLAAIDAATAELLAGDPEAAAPVLEYLASEPARWRAAARVVAASSLPRAEALRPIARTAYPEALSALVGNERALAADPELGATLAANPSLPAGDRLRLLDLLDEVAKRSTPRVAPGTAAPAGTEGPAPARDPFLAALGIDVEVEKMLPELGLDLGALQERSELMGDAESDDEASLMTRLGRLNVGQKLRVALFGGREERALLIRDSNRIVAAAVVKNPRFTAPEAETAANSRNVNAEVLRLVARHRDFSQIYSLQHALVCNPRCPPEIAMPLVAHMSDRDLRLLVKNRNISEMVRRQVKKITDVREERRRGRVATTKH